MLVMSNITAIDRLVERAVAVTTLDATKSKAGRFYFLLGQGIGLGQLWLCVKNASGVLEFVFVANGGGGPAAEDVRMVSGALSSIALIGVDPPEIAGQWVVRANAAAMAYRFRAVLTGGPAGETATLVIENLTTPGTVATLTSTSATPEIVEQALPFVATASEEIYQATLVTGTINVPVFLGGLDVLTVLAP